MSDTPRTDAHYKQIYDEGLGLEYCETELRYWAEKLERELVEAKAERERCARVCEEFYSVEGVAQKCAAAIRKGE